MVRRCYDCIHAERKGLQRVYCRVRKETYDTFWIDFADSCEKFKDKFPLKTRNRYICAVCEKPYGRRLVVVWDENAVCRECLRRIVQRWLKEGFINEALTSEVKKVKEAREMLEKRLKELLSPKVK